jgi:hypothetical protein
MSAEQPTLLRTNAASDRSVGASIADLTTAKPVSSIVRRLTFRMAIVNANGNRTARLLPPHGHLGRGARLVLAVTLNWLRANRAVQRVRLHQHSLPERFFSSVRPSDGILWRKA